jgi:hypothetical protein
MVYKRKAQEYKVPLRMGSEGARLNVFCGGDVKTHVIGTKYENQYIIGKHLKPIRCTTKIH